MQDVAAFAATAQAVAWFALSYRDLFQLSARVQRLAGMQAAMAQPPAQGIAVSRDGSAAAVEGEDVGLGPARRPPAQPHRRAALRPGRALAGARPPLAAARARCCAPSPGCGRSSRAASACRAVRG